MKTYIQILHLLKRISNRIERAKEREVWQIVQVLLVSPILYGLLYHLVNRTQKLSLENLFKAGRRIIPGLPRYTVLKAPESFSLQELWSTSRSPVLVPTTGYGISLWRALSLLVLVEHAAPIVGDRLHGDAQETQTTTPPSDRKFVSTTDSNRRHSYAFPLYRSLKISATLRSSLRAAQKRNKM